MASVNFTVSVENNPTSGSDLLIDIGPAPADWRLARVLGSVYGGAAKIRVFVDSRRAGSIIGRNTVLPIEFGNGDSSSREASGIKVPRGKLCRVLMEVTVDDAPPGGWETHCTVVGIAENFGDQAAIEASVSTIPSGGGLPGEPVSGSTWG